MCVQDDHTMSNKSLNTPKHAFLGPLFSEYYKIIGLLLLHVHLLAEAAIGQYVLLIEYIHALII